MSLNTINKKWGPVNWIYGILNLQREYSVIVANLATSQGG